MLWTWMRFVRRAQAWRGPARRRSKTYWEPINEIYHLDIAVVNPIIDRRSRL